MLRKQDKSVKDSYNLDLDAFPDSASGSGSDAASGMDSISGSGIVKGPDTVAGSVTGFVPALRLIRISCFAINKYRIDMTIHYNKKISNACEDEKIRSILG